MAFMLKQGGQTDYNYKEYYCDADADKDAIDVRHCAPGSVAYIVSNGSVYILNNQKEWVAQ